MDGLSFVIFLAGYYFGVMCCYIFSHVFDGNY